MMSSYFMIEMRQISLSRLYFIYERQRFLKGKMREMIAIAESIYNENIDPFEFLQLLLIYGLGICDIRKISDTES